MNKIDKFKLAKYSSISSIPLALIFGLGLIPAILGLVLTVMGIKGGNNEYKNNILYIIMGMVASIIILGITIVAIVIFNQ